MERVDTGHFSTEPSEERQLMERQFVLPSASMDTRF